MIRKSLQDKIDYSVDLLRRSEEMALRLDPENGFHLAFSGGKDSQALYYVAKLAGVQFKAHMSLTSVDPAELIRFVKRNYPDVEMIKPKMSIYDMALKKHILPTKRMRWCCAEYKEVHGAGKVTLIGIRRQESARRSKRKEFSDRRRSGRLWQRYRWWRGWAQAGRCARAVSLHRPRGRCTRGSCPVCSAGLY